MKKLFFFALLVPVALFAQAVPIVYQIPIQNPSFEQAVKNLWTGPCGYQGPLAGWTGNNASTLQLLPGNPCGIPAFPDGPTVAILDNGTISQDLGSVESLLPRDAQGEINGTYLLRVSLANYFYWYPAQYSASLIVAGAATLRGQTVLCSTSGWAMGDFQEIVLVCPSQRVFGELSLSFSSNGPEGAFWPVAFDKVSLKFRRQS